MHIYLLLQGLLLPGLSRGLFSEAGLIRKEINSMEFKELDPILHSQLRLAVMSLLISVKEAEFIFIKEKTNSSAGNLSVQLIKLKEAGYPNDFYSLEEGVGDYVKNYLSKNIFC